MSKYIQIFVWPMPKNKVLAYRKIIKKFEPIFRKLGVVEYKEYMASDLRKKFGMGSISSKVKHRPRETLLFAVMGFRSKTHCNQVMKRFEKYEWKDMEKMTKLVNHRRMAFGEFSLL